MDNNDIKKQLDSLKKQAQFLEKKLKEQEELDEKIKKQRELDYIMFENFEGEG